MNRKWGRFVACSFLLLATGIPSAVCRAMPQEEQLKAQDHTETAAADPKESTSADKPTTPVSDSGDYDSSLGIHVIKNIAEDQKAIWTFPAHLRLVDVQWIMPFGLLTAGTLATDTEFSKHLSNSPSRIKYSNDFSNFGLGAMAGVGGGLYLLGQFTHDDHKREAGLLAGEAAINSTAIVTALKYSFGRQRPLENNYQGNFWSGGDSLPSEHAAAAWSIASVLAHEYP